MAAAARRFAARRLSPRRAPLATTQFYMASSTMPFSMDINEEELIRLVQAHPELYDVNDPLYDVKQRREHAWKEIGRAINKSVRDCRDRWKRLRDCYRRAQRLRKSKSQQGHKMIKKPKHEKILSFLDPYLKEKTTADDQDSSNDDTNLLDEMYSSSRDSSQNQPPYKRKLVESAATPEPTGVCATPAAPLAPCETVYMATPVPLPPKHDKLIDFFMGLVETVRDFPEDVQIRVKRDIFKVISDAEESVFRNKSQQSVQFVNTIKMELNCLTEDSL